MTSRPRKIMYLLDAYVHSRAGTEGQLLQLVTLLDRSRYLPAATLLRPSEYIQRTGFACPVDVLGIQSLASPVAIFKVARLALKLRRDGYRLVHCFFNDVSIIAPALLKLFGIRVVVARRDMGFWYTPGKLFCLRRVTPFVDRYIANSNAVKNVVASREHVPHSKISVIYNGYTAQENHPDTETSPPLVADIPKNHRIVGIVANLRPIKRLDTLVEAFALVCRRFADAYLIIVGDDAPSAAGNIREALECLSSDLGVRDRVIFTGACDSPQRVIKRFDVAVLCSESEGFSNAIIEYMQCARPVVCTDVGGNPEIVQDGQTGFLVPVGDSVALADRIARLLADPALARRLGQAGYRVARSFTGPRMVAEQMACYDEVMDGIPMYDASIEDSTAPSSPKERKLPSGNPATPPRGTADV